MPYLTDEQIAELVDGSLKDLASWIVRGGSRSRFNLVEPLRHGMRGVVWKATDDLGTPVALKIIPSEDYIGLSLIDEMTEASKLDSNYFARVLFFGELEVRDEAGIRKLSTNYKAVATEYINGIPFDEYVGANPLTGEDFLLLAQNLFTALAILRKNDLSHDDLHPGNVLIQKVLEPLNGDPTIALKVIDTGTVKRTSSRQQLLTDLRDKLSLLKETNAPTTTITKFETLLSWKEPDDHLRAIECLIRAANSVAKNYYRLEFWERAFSDQLLLFFQKATDADINSRLDSPSQVVSELRALAGATKAEETKQEHVLASPFDYISAEMIRNDREFAELFSRECPWLDNCKSLEPLYIYGPRGCGKSSVLRWLSFKTLLSDPTRDELVDIREIGVYVSCSVELRSRFWLLNEATIEKLQTQIIRFFNLLLLEELLDTLLTMWRLEYSDTHHFGFKTSNLHEFATWVISRLFTPNAKPRLRLQGQSYFDYLRGFVRKLRWDTWASIQKGEPEPGLPDPSLASDVCRI
ncbi:MAG TPA: hypothetical protein VGO47_13895, partial [Chlamydiales bacterium]|nr:hypothetical protein [Chlamydiales bacterium]